MSRLVFWKGKLAGDKNIFGVTEEYFWGFSWRASWLVREREDSFWAVAERGDSI